MTKRCYCCREIEEFENDIEFLCDKCRLNGCKLTFPGTTGLSDGPTSGMSQVCFNKPDPYKETLRAMKSMEAHGQLKDRKTIAVMQSKLKMLKAKQEIAPRVDYDKRGGELHPLSGEGQ